MKIYNKKGFVWGIFWTILGAARLVLLVTHPEEQTVQLIKGLAFGIVFLTIGLSGFTRAFSKQATREDIIRANDERNKLVKLKKRHA